MSVKLFGLIPLAHAGGDDESARGELMRYLAELPWCPDATLCNNALTWRVVSPKLIAVTAGEGACLAQVDLHLSDEGLIGEVRAPDRPRATKRGFQPTPWLGRFSDYRETDGARIPWRGEVGWVLEGDEIMVWQGELRAWRRVE